MKKILIFAARNDNMALDWAVVKRHEGYEVFFIGCDKSFGICNFNNSASSCICRFCKYTMMKKIRLMLDDEHIHYDSLASLAIKYGIKQNKGNYHYNNIKELKNINYKEVEIGYGAFSLFATATRNIYPEFNAYFHSYIDYILDKEVYLTDILEAYLAVIKPDEICFHNGRFPNYKPFYCLSLKHKLDFIATELMHDAQGRMITNYFYNDVPHSVKAIGEKVVKGWETGSENKESIAHDFFKNRKYGKYAGDTIYTKKQEVGLLPEYFNTNKQNIAIFNSSEDEYFSVSKEFDENNLYESQYVALKTIFEHYKNNNDIHFYLRIHPNLGTVPYKSHTALYDLKYDNVTIIPPYSPISSYALMDACEKVMVFNSTMGLESDYWGKAVIALNLTEFDTLGLVYTPKSEQELWHLVEDRSLTSKNQHECLKMAYYYMGGIGEVLHYYPNVFTTRKIWKVEYLEESQFSLLGSTKLQGLTERLLTVLRGLGMLGRFPKLAERTK